MSAVYIGRQPILDRKMKLFAYVLQFHQGLNPNQESVEASAQLLAKTESEIGLQAIVGGHVALINLPRDVMVQSNDFASFEDKHNLVLEIPNYVDKDVDVLKKLKELKSQGVAIALDNYIEEDASLKLANISDFVKLDNEALSEVKMKSAIEALHAKGKKVIAEKVDTEEMYQYLKKLGFDYFQGYFFTNPVIINGKKLTGNKLTLLQILAKINDPKTSFKELSSILSKDVALTHKLLVAVNNPAAMIPIEVETVSDALNYMGLKRLKFWVNMMMLSDLNDVPKELLTTSLMRAKFCEALAIKAGFQREKDSYFLVGLFSNLGAFFRSPVAEIVAEMPLSAEIKLALIERKGSMGEALKCLTELESTSQDFAKLTFNQLDINDIAGLFMEASAWAHQASVE